jgi:hypothetical protein
MQLNYALNKNDYTWSNALCWGNCFNHLEKAKDELSDNSTRFIHGVIFAVELLPIIGQIASLFEKLIVDCLGYSDGAPDLTGRDISVDSAADPRLALGALQPRTIADMRRRFEALTGCRLYGDEQVEVALDGVRVGPTDVFTPWKLHISATPENAVQVLGAVFGTLVRCRPHFKFVKNEQLLKEYNEFVNPAFPERGRFKEGKFITIYAPDEEHAIKWACELNESLEDAVKDGRLQQNAPGAAVNRTDRPIGNTGFLWARHDMAGCPITDKDFQEGCHAQAAVGNYQTTTHFPVGWVDLPPAEMEKRIKDRANGVVSVLHPDIFEHDWGKVVWSPERHCFQPAH